MQRRGLKITVWRLAVLTLCVLLTVAHARGAGSIPATYAANGPSGSVPAGLPSHVMLGLANDPSDLSWMTGSGVPWDARYQYLSGGVNTGSGWATWNSPAGAFALDYMQASGAAGYLPVFSYYQLLQSKPASGSTEEAQDDSNITNASTMNAYYADFALLMQQAHTYGKQVIVQVEPDLWGYMEQEAGTCGLASCVSASVASSGYADVAGYPNTVQGFAEALLHLRDKYAPNVLMAIHASCWGSGSDVCNFPTSLANTATNAAQDATFLSSAGITGNQAGTSSWDLVFAETSDRDAGYYQYVEGNTGYWWDPTNHTLPDYTNFLTYIQDLNSGAGRRIVLWQMPLGNQYFDTDNNTNGHYQDNRAQYFLGNGPSYGNMTSFANAGVIGLLFGAGAGGATTNTDAMGDGITNPAPVSSFQCNNCNTHTSQYSDDDGGYLRQFGGAYLKAGGAPIPGAGTVSTPTPTATGVTPSATPTKAVPSPTPVSTSSSLSFSWKSVSESSASIQPGGTETFTVSIVANQSVSNELVDFEVYNSAGAKVWQVYQSPVSFTANKAKTFKTSWSTPTNLANGAYTLKLGVFTSAWSLQLWNNSAATFSA